MGSASESNFFPSIIVTRPSEKKNIPPYWNGDQQKKKRKSTSQEIVVILGCLLREKSFPKSLCEAANDSSKAFRVEISHVFTVGKAGIIPEGNELMEEAHFLGGKLPARFHQPN